jgi:hypothetical protein
MKQIRSPWLAALAVVLIGVGVGALLVRPTFASPFFGFGPGFGPGYGPWHNGGWDRSAIPPELAGLADVPADQRFAHFRGVQVQVTDKDNRPVRVDVVPGTVSSVSSSSLTIAGNDGATHTYTLDDKTMQRGSAPKQNDKVVVATLNGSSTATAVFAMSGNDFGPRGPWGH